MTKQEFQHIVTPIQDKLYRFALRFVQTIPEAEDVVQEVLIKLWQQRDRLASITNLEAWTIRMTRNHSIDKIRARKTTDDIEQVRGFASDAPTPGEVIEQKDTFDMVETIMQQLPEKQRMVMHLRDIEEYTYQEIAETLQLPLNQVKVNLFRARKFVRERLVTVLKA